MGFAGGKTWGQMIKAELVELKIRVSALEKRLDKAGFAGSPVGKLDKTKPLSETTRDLVESTFTIRTTTVAMRGYLQLLSQANLPQDQKKLVRELQYSAMAIMKTAQAIKLLILAYQAFTTVGMGPKGLLFLFLAGGVTASSLAYSSRLTGGTV